MTGIEIGKCSVEGCNFLQDGKCFIVEEVKELAETGTVTPQDWAITVKYYDSQIKDKRCINALKSKEELYNITPKNVVESKEKI